MTNEQFLFTLFCTVFFCLGLNQSLSEGYLLHFIRRPFDKMYDEVENQKQLYKTYPPNSFDAIAHYFKRFVLFIVKPICLCITCMASVWGVSWFVLLNGFNNDLVIYLILNSFIASFIQTFIYNLYAKYIQ